MSLSPTLFDAENPPSDPRMAAVGIFTSSGVQLNGFDPSKGSNAVLTQLPYASGSQILLAANPARRKFRTVNPTNKTIYGAYGPTASLAAYTFSVAQGGSFESDLNEYTGVVSVIWPAAPANGPELQTTEIT